MNYNDARKALPNADCLLPMLICAVVIMVAALVALILVFRRIGVWSRNGEKQEPLKKENA